jgi:cytochrome c biogenesis protein CcdA
MDYVLAYGAGLLTLINPCVLPVLPIVLATALQASRTGPLALAAGMSLSFVVLGLLVASVGHAIGLREDTVAQASAVMMVAFGLVLTVPRLSTGFATATAGVAARADAGMDRIDRAGLGGQFLGGALLGAVWSPCIGPTLGGAIALAAQGERLLHAGAIMAAFALGVSTLIIGLGFGARGAIMKRQGALRALAGRARPAMGIVFLVVGAALFFGLHYRIEAWMLDHMPYWLQDLSVSL